MSLDELTFPVAETFYSIQGEGTYAGTPMFFIRLAGCNIGKYSQAPNVGPGRTDLHRGVSEFQVLNQQYATCTSYSGTQFVCDTDYRVKERITIDDLLQQIPQGCNHVSITGGEPFIHKSLMFLVMTLINSAGVKVHLETSGTLPLDRVYENNFDIRMLWVTCSPKQGFLQENIQYVDQFKFLVENEQDVKAVYDMVTGIGETPIFIQPIEHYDANGPIKSSYDFVVDVVKKHPTWRLSIQMHKVLGVR